jgi:hypothetical protein
MGSGSRFAFRQSWRQPNDWIDEWACPEARPRSPYDSRVFFPSQASAHGSGILFVDGSEELRQRHIHWRIGGLKALRADPVAITAIPPFTCL